MKELWPPVTVRESAETFQADGAPDVWVAGGVLAGAGGGGVDGSAMNVPLSVAGADSGGAPGSVDPADEGAGAAVPDAGPPGGTDDGCVPPGAAAFRVTGAPRPFGPVAEGDGEGLVADLRERALRFAEPEAFVNLPDAIAPAATAAPAEITIAATTATT